MGEKENHAFHNFSLYDGISRPILKPNIFQLRSIYKFCGNDLWHKHFMGA